MFNHELYRDNPEAAIIGCSSQRGKIRDNDEFETPVGTFIAGHRYYEGFTKRELNKRDRGIKIWVARTNPRDSQRFDYHLVRDDENGDFVYEVLNRPNESPRITAGGYVETLPERVVLRAPLPAEFWPLNTENTMIDLAEVSELYGLTNRINNKSI